jgi:hypothetical protein
VKKKSKPCKWVFQVQQEMQAVSQSVRRQLQQQKKMRSREREGERERERERERELFFTFSCAHRLASPCAQTPAESSSSPLPRSTTSRCWISAPHNHHQSMHLSVLSQIILPQNAVKIRVLTFFGNVYSRRNRKLCIDRRKMAPPHLLPLPSPSEEEIFFNRMQNRTNCCENRERLLIKKSGTR